MLQLGLYKHLVTIIDRPNTSSPYFKSDKSQNDKIKQFMNSVQDNNEVLKRLTLIGYFDQKECFNLISSHFNSDVNRLNTNRHDSI